VGIYGHLDIEDSLEALKSLPQLPVVESEKETCRPDRSMVRMFHLCSKPIQEGQEHKGLGPENVSETEALIWSGTPDSNWRPSPWQRGGYAFTALHEAPRIVTIL
jgi:hypothetical protein